MQIQVLVAPDELKSNGLRGSYDPLTNIITLPALPTRGAANYYDLMHTLTHEMHHASLHQQLVMNLSTQQARLDWLKSEAQGKMDVFVQKELGREWESELKAWSITKEAANNDPKAPPRFKNADPKKEAAKYQAEFEGSYKASFEKRWDKWYASIKQRAPKDIDFGKQGDDVSIPTTKKKKGSPRRVLRGQALPRIVRPGVSAAPTMRRNLAPHVINFAKKVFTPTKSVPKATVHHPVRAPGHSRPGTAVNRGGAKINPHDVPHVHSHYKSPISRNVRVPKHGYFFINHDLDRRGRVIPGAFRGTSIIRVTNNPHRR